MLMVAWLLYSLYMVTLLIIGGNSSQDYSFKFLVGLAIFVPLVGFILPVSFVIFLCSFKNEACQARNT